MTVYLTGSNTTFKQSFLFHILSVFLFQWVGIVGWGSSNWWGVNRPLRSCVADLYLMHGGTLYSMQRVLHKTSRWLVPFGIFNIEYGPIPLVRVVKSLFHTVYRMSLDNLIM